MTEPPHVRVWTAVDAWLTHRRLWAVSIFTVSLGFILAIVAASLRLPFTSDDVAIQNIMQSAVEVGELDAVVGIDSFAVKVPLYALVALVLPNGTTAILVTVILCDAILLAGMFFATRELLARVAPHDRLVLLATLSLFLWFFAAQLTQNQSLMIPNGRNAEIGLVLAAFGIGFRYLDRARTGPTRTAPAWAAVIVITLVYYSDPFFLIVTAPAVVIVVAFLWMSGALSGRRSLAALGVLGASAVAAVTGLAVAAGFGLTYEGNFSTVFTTPAALADNVGRAFGALAVDFNADVWGGSLGLGTLPGIVQLGLFVTAVVLLPFAARVASGHRLWFGHFVMAAIGVNLAVFVLTENAATESNSRYLLFAALAMLLIAPLGLVALSRSLTRRRVLAFVSAVAVLGGIVGMGANALTLTRFASGELPDPQAGTREIVEIAEEAGAVKGYGGYWSANVTTYLSGRATVVLPIDCSDGISRYEWFINRPDFERPARSVFFIASPTGACTAETIIGRFGSPDRTVTLLESDATLLFYTGDPEMPSS